MLSKLARGLVEWHQIRNIFPLELFTSLFGGLCGRQQVSLQREARVMARDHSRAANQCLPPILSDTRRSCDVESTSMTLIQRRNNVVCPVASIFHPSFHKVWRVLALATDKNVKYEFLWVWHPSLTAIFISGHGSRIDVFPPPAPILAGTWCRGNDSPSLD